MLEVSDHHAQSLAAARGAAVPAVPLFFVIHASVGQFWLDGRRVRAAKAIQSQLALAPGVAAPGAFLCCCKSHQIQKKRRSPQTHQHELAACLWWLYVSSLHVSISHKFEFGKYLLTRKGEITQYMGVFW